MPAQAQSAGSKRRPESDAREKPSGKRSRVSRACDQCRLAREKCDGVQPICSTCSGSRRACSYTANPKKRGIQPGYIRTLELALTWLFNSTDAENLLDKKLAHEGAQSILLGRDTRESNKLHRTWRRSKFYKDIDRLLSGEEVGRHDFTESLESDDPDESEHEVVAPVDISPVQIDSIVFPHLATYEAQSQNITQVSPRPPENVPLPRMRWRLFEVYFSYTHCWLPICEKHDILKLTYSYPDTGLPLSASMSDSSEHALLWSVLALASIQDLSHPAESHCRDEPGATSEQLYSTARSLIPLESGVFRLGHAKALILLALVNLSQTALEAAWLLVGHAGRILIGLEVNEASDPRFKHTVAACFLLDTIMSTHMNRRPNLHSADVHRVGKVNEDGLEEWQPWSGCIGPVSSNQHSGIPALSLSCFNFLVDIVGIMGHTGQVGNNVAAIQETSARIDLWKSSLPPTLQFIRDEHVAVPETPPAMLLYLAYLCATLNNTPSQMLMQQIVNLLERLRDRLGSIALPPIAYFFFEIIGRDAMLNLLDQTTQLRFHKIRDDFDRAWMRTPQIRTVGAKPKQTQTLSTRSRPSFSSSSVQMPTPESIQIPFQNGYTSFGNSVNITGPRTSSTLLEDLLPDIGPGSAPQHIVLQDGPVVQDMGPRPFDVFSPPALHRQNSATSRDVQDFFDELASLDGAEKLSNQSQFLQNLGFAPDANMADLLASDFGPLNPMVSSYMQQTSDESGQLDTAHLFDGG